MSTEEYLSSKGVTVEIARDFIMNNYESNLETVFNVCKEFGVNNDMIADVLENDISGLTGEIVADFFNANAFDGDSLGHDISNLVGKTFYNIDSDDVYLKINSPISAFSLEEFNEADSQDKVYNLIDSQWVLDETYEPSVVTSLDVNGWQSYTKTYGNGFSTTGSIDSINGDVWTFFIETSNDDSFYIDLYTAPNDYVLNYSFSDGTDLNASSDSEIFEFTTEWLNGRTLYNIFDDDDNGIFESSATFSFTDSTYSAEEGFTNIHTLSGTYEIIEDGIIYMSALSEDDQPSYIRAYEMENEPNGLELIWSEELTYLLSATEGNDNEYFFLDQSTAELYIA